MARQKQFFQIFEKAPGRKLFVMNSSLPMSCQTAWSLFLWSYRMSENKYFWLKLKKDFFHSEDVKIVKSHKNGNDYVIFWLQLLLKAISQDQLGILRYKTHIPYTAEILSTVTDTNIDIVKGAMMLFKELGMIELKENGDIWIEGIQELIGSEGKSAERVRKFRQKQKALPCNKVKQNGNIEIEIDKEKELDKDIDKDIKKYVKKEMNKTEYIPSSELINLWNESKLENVPKITMLSQDRYKKYKLRAAAGLDFRAILNKIKQSDFLQGKNKDGWTVTFDWIIGNDKNWIKVMEGNYDNKKPVLEEQTGKGW